VRKARKPLAILLAVAMMLCMAPAAVFGASDNSADVERIAEHDRYMTAAKIAETAFPDGAKTVVIANGEDTLDYADALAGSFLAGVVKAPILLTRTDTLPKATKDVIRGKLGATEAYILGGTAAVSEAVVSELKDDLKLKVTRVAGVNRFETAAKILEVGAKLGAEVPDTALIANGTRPADGLVASAYAYKENIPVLLVLQNNIPPETKKALKGIKNTYVIGGEFVVSDDILNALPNATRLSGDTRFHTSVAVAKQLWKSPGNFALVQGIDGLVDALAGAVLGVPILYAAPDQPDPQAVEPQVVADYLDSAITENSSGFVLGGRISANVVNAVQQKIEQKKEQKKPIADLKVVEVTAVDANTIKVIFEGVDEPVTIKLDEALVHGKNEVTFEYEGVEYTVTVDYVDPEYKNPDEDDPIDTGLITAIKGAQDAIKSLPALSDLDLGAKKDVETARAKVEQAKKLGATNIDIGLDLIDILEKAEAKIALLEAKTTLQMKINEATEFNEADYTAASWQALQAALANARSAAADENASQTQIDQALDDLNAAISALVEKHIWQTVTIAWSDNIAGLFTSMDTDSFGRPHISYYDATDGDLMYVWQDDSGWHSETVDSEGNTGKFTSLAVDANGIPHISYYDLTNGKIKHAIRNNSTWEKTEVDEVCTGVDGGYYTGVSTSIAIDNSNRPHISYYDYNQQCLKHAWLDGNVWGREIVEAPLTKTGECSSITTDSQGRPHIAYSDKNKNQLKYAYKSGETGDTWQIKAVESDNKAAKNISLTLDNSGSPCISYTDNTDDLKYACKAEGHWQIELAGDKADHTTSLALDSSGPQISYWGKNDNKLKFAWKDAFGWQNTEVDRGLSAGFYSSLAIDSAGYYHISYYDPAGGGKLKYATTLPDTTPPQLIKTDPADGAVGIPVSKTITLTFNEDVDVNFDKITLSCSDQTAVGYSGSVQGNVINITPQTDLEPVTEYTVQIDSGAVKDLAGNPFDTYTFSFKTDKRITWTKNLDEACNYLRGVAYNGSLYVAVGGDGTVKTSPDGSNWVSRISGTSNQLNGITWNNSQFVAVGSFGTVITSPDGINWTTQTTATVEWLNDITWSGSQFVAVGGSGAVLTSPDGSNWTAQNSDTTEPLNAVAWNGSQFVAVGNNGTIITSSDGASWKTQNSGTNKGLLGIAWGDSKFVAVDMSGKVYTSPDGTVWSVQDSGTKKYLQKVTWNGSQFAAVGASGTILTSPDGINWTTRSTGTTKWIFGIGWGCGKYVAVGDVNTILTSADGVDWITQSSSDMESLNGVTWGKDRFVAVGDQGTIITSTDGFAWSPQNSGTVKGLSRVIWGKDQFVAIGDQGTILTSPDGSNWTAQDSGTINHLKGITWSGSQYVAVGILGTILTSPDGISWTAQQSGARWGLYGVTWGKNKFVAVGDLGTVLTSPDGITWTPQTLTAMAKASYYDVAWNGSKFVAGGRPERIITSADGISWTFQIPGTTEGLYGVACSSGQFAAVGYPGTILTSPDGISWADHFTNTSNQLNDIAWGNDKIVAVGIFRTILTSEAPPALEVVSTDPVSDATDIPVGKTINVTFNGNVTADFSKISVSYSNSGGEQATAECSYSVNGNVISIEPKLPLQHNTTYKVHIPCGAVQNQSGKPLASDYSFSFTTAISLDIAWTKVLDANNLRSVAYNGSGLYAAVGNDGTVKTSTDRVSWTSRVSGTTNQLNSITWGNNRFVVVGNSGTIITSTAYKNKLLTLNMLINMSKWAN
jgi:putative cell wall-binding protein/methionine-rich copper-binding protein CopC